MTTSFGTLADYATGDFIRKATPAEWRKSADQVNSGNETGAFDLDGKSVFVNGGPEAEIGDPSIWALRDEAASAGDDAQVSLCELAIDGNEDAFAKCVSVILDNRMEMA
jgi:hypothetical protein